MESEAGEAGVAPDASGIDSVRALLDADAQVSEQLRRDLERDTSEFEAIVKQEREQSEREYKDRVAALRSQNDALRRLLDQSAASAAAPAGATAASPAALDARHAESFVALSKQFDSDNPAILQPLLHGAPANAGGPAAAAADAGEPATPSK